MQSRFENIAIKGIQVVVPENTVNNMDYAEQLGEKRCKKQIRLTGVKKRHVSVKNQTATDLAYLAGSNLLKKLKWSPDEIDVLLYVTQNPKFALPSTAFYLQKMLGINKSCLVYDINLGCSGAVVGMQTAASLLCGNNKGKAVVIICDAVFDEISNDMQPDEIANQLLFGSAASAIGLQCDENILNPMYFTTNSDGTRYNAIVRMNGGRPHMDGEAVFSFGVNEVSAGMIAFRKNFGLNEEDIDYYSFHQAQALMLSTICASCDIDSSKELRSLDEYGNTNGSSVIVNLAANIDKLKEKANSHVILCGFGVGLSWSYLYTNLSSDSIYPILFSNETIQGE